MPICWEPCGGVFFESKGIANHRVAHQRRGERVVVQLKVGTYEYEPHHRESPDDYSMCICGQVAGHHNEGEKR